MTKGRHFNDKKIDMAIKEYLKINNFYGRIYIRIKYKKPINWEPSFIAKYSKKRAIIGGIAALFFGMLGYIDKERFIKAKKMPWLVIKISFLLSIQPLIYIDFVVILIGLYWWIKYYALYILLFIIIIPFLYRIIESLIYYLALKYNTHSNSMLQICSTAVDANIGNSNDLVYLLNRSPMPQDWFLYGYAIRYNLNTLAVHFKCIPKEYFMCANTNITQMQQTLIRQINKNYTAYEIVNNIGDCGALIAKGSDFIRKEDFENLLNKGEKYKQKIISIWEGFLFVYDRKKHKILNNDIEYAKNIPDSSTIVIDIDKKDIVNVRNIRCNILSKYIKKDITLPKRMLIVDQKIPFFNPNKL